jgi:hypothetical protein
VESFECRIATHGNQSRHVEHASDGRATAPDAASSFELAAVEGVGCTTCLRFMRPSSTTKAPCRGWNG